jgi:hypothetical protein
LGSEWAFIASEPGRRPRIRGSRPATADWRSGGIAARLGDDPKTVLSTYAHLLPQSDEMAAERVAAAISG